MTDPDPRLTDPLPADPADTSADHQRSLADPNGTGELVDLGGGGSSTSSWTELAGGGPDSLPRATVERDDDGREAAARREREGLAGEDGAGAEDAGGRDATDPGVTGAGNVGG